MNTTTRMLRPLVAALLAWLSTTSWVLAAGADGLAAAQRGGDQEQVERFTRTIAVGPEAELELSNISGDIVVRGGTGSDIVIDVTKRSRSAPEDLDEVEVEIEARGQLVEVSTRYPRRRDRDRRFRVSVSFDVTVPRDTAVSVTSVSGDIRVSDVDREARIQNVSGDIELRGLRQATSVETVSGDIDLDGVTADRDLELTTVSGDVRGRDLAARDLTLETVSGDVDLADARFDRLTFSSVSGDLEYEGPLVEGGRYELDSHSGDLRLTITEDVGFELEAASFSGSVRSDLPVVIGGSGNSGGGRRREQRVQGRFGDGSARIEVSTFSGDIVLSRR